MIKENSSFEAELDQILKLKNRNKQLKILEDIFDEGRFYEERNYDDVEAYKEELKLEINELTSITLKNKEYISKEEVLKLLDEVD